MKLWQAFFHSLTHHLTNTYRVTSSFKVLFVILEMQQDIVLVFKELKSADSMDIIIFSSFILMPTLN